MQTKITWSGIEMSQTRKEYRAEMRAKHGPDWWKKANPTQKWDVKGYRKEWQGFPRYVGGLPFSSLDEPDYAKPGDDLIYSGETRHRYHRGDVQGIRVEKTWGRWGDAFHVIEFIRSGGERYTGRILTGAGREKTIRFLKGLKGYA